MLWHLDKYSTSKKKHGKEEDRSPLSKTRAGDINKTKYGRGNKRVAVRMSCSHCIGSSRGMLPQSVFTDHADDEEADIRDLPPGETV